MKLSTLSKFVTSTIFIFTVLTNYASAATVSFFTPTKAYVEGSDIVLSVLVSTDGKPASAISGLISFPSDLLSVSSISKDDSIVSNWIQEPSISNTSGSISFESLIVSGFRGNLGKLLTVTFKSKSTGTASIKFIAGSILTIDGITNDILLNSEGAILKISKIGSNKDVVSNIKEESNVTKITKEIPTMKPDSNGWYSLDSTNFTRIANYPKVPTSLIISVILLGLVIWYLYYNLFRRENKLKKEVYEAEEAIHKAFDILKGSEEDQLVTLEKKSTKVKSTIKKERAKRQFKKDLSDAEKYIEKEIGDIDKLLNKK